MINLRLLKVSLVSIALLISSQAWAQTFSAPVPIASDEAQVANIPSAVRSNRSSNATNLKFFNHPLTASDEANFHETFLVLSMEEGEYYVPVQNLAAVPGLIPSPQINVRNLGEMLDEMIVASLGIGLITRLPTEGISPTYGFCPEPLVIEDSSRTVEGRNAEVTINFMCNVQSTPPSRRDSNNESNRQLEVADIRNTTSADEFAALINEEPLVPTALGDAQQSLAPYSNQTYPSTITSNLPFDYLSSLASSGLTRLVAPYSGVFNYGLADLEQSVVTASYDPIRVEKALHLAGNFYSADLAGLSPDCARAEGCFLGQIEIEPGIAAWTGFYNSFLNHLTPLIFFRKDQAEHRLRLSGYSTWQFDNIDIDNLVGTLDDFLWKMLMSLNFNTIDVQAIERQEDGDNYLAVVNQGTLGSLDYPVVDLQLRRVSFSGTSYDWRDMLGTGSGADFMPLRQVGEPGELYFPHSAVSYVTFWQQVDESAINPNEAFDPVAFGLIGPGAYSSTELIDVIGDTTRQYFVVPSGEALEGGIYYIYKFAAEEREDNILHFDPQPAVDNDNIWPTPGIVAEPYLVKSPEGFAPYEIKAADLDENGCSEIILTHRGANTVWVPPIDVDTFNNTPGENVVFQSSLEDDERMFSDCFTVYFGDLQGDKCIFSTDRQDFCGTLESGRQIASVAITDTNDDGHLDIVAGDLMPMEIPDSAGKFTGYAHVYHGPITLSTPGRSEMIRGEADDFIRFGYQSTTHSPFSAAAGSPARYLMELAEGSDKGIVGVGKLDVDENGNLAAVLGFPVMLPSMGCPQYDMREDTTVTSWPEMWMTLLRERVAPFSSRGDDGNILPARCLVPGAMPPSDGQVPEPEPHAPTIDIDIGTIDGSFWATAAPRDDEDDGGETDSDSSGTINPGTFRAPEYRTCQNPVYEYNGGFTEVLKCCDPCNEISSRDLRLCRTYCDDPEEPSEDFAIMCAHIEECPTRGPVLSPDNTVMGRTPTGNLGDEDDDARTTIEPSDDFAPANQVPLGEDSDDNEMPGVRTEIDPSDIQNDEDVMPIGEVGRSSGAEDTLGAGRMASPGLAVERECTQPNLTTRDTDPNCCIFSSCYEMPDYVRIPCLEKCDELDERTTYPVLCEMMAPCRMGDPGPERPCVHRHSSLNCCEIARTCEGVEEAISADTYHTSDFYSCFDLHCITGIEDGTRVGQPEPNRDGTPNPDNRIICEMLSTCLREYEPESSLNKTERTKFLAKGSKDGDSNDDSADSNETKFARNCDRVYDSQAGYLAFLQDMQTAAAQVKDYSSGYKQQTNQQTQDKKSKLELVIDQYLKNLNVPEAQAEKISKQLRDHFAGPPTSLAEILIRPFLYQIIKDMKLQTPDTQSNYGPNAKNMSSMSNPLLSLSSRGYAAGRSEAIQSVSNLYCFGANVPGNDSRSVIASDPGLLEYITSLFVSEAQAAEYVEEPFDSHFRLPRGQVMRGPKEITVVIKSTAGREMIGGEYPDDIARTEDEKEDGTDGDGIEDDEQDVIDGGEIDDVQDEDLITGYIEKAQKCTGWSSPAAKKKGEEINRLIRDALAAGGFVTKSDFYCESQGKMEILLNIPLAASLSKGASNGEFSGVVAPNAFIQTHGTYPNDYTKLAKLPTETHIVDSPKILFPLASSGGGAKATFVMPDLSLAATEATNSNISAELSQAAPLQSSLVSSVGVMESGAFSLNNVLKIDIAAIPTQLRAVDSDIGSAFIHIEDHPRPALCSWTARCPETEATLPENSFALLKTNFDQFLAGVRENAGKCKKGYCPPEVFAGWPEYQRYGYIWVQGKTVDANTDNIQISYVGGPAFEAAAGGGCGCSLNAPMPNLVSLIVMLLFAGFPVGVRFVLSKRLK